MAKLIRAYDNANRPIVPEGDATLDMVYFTLLRLRAGEAHDYQLPAHESLAVVLSGQANIVVDGEAFEHVGTRPDIWSGQADSVYAGRAAKVRIEAVKDTEIAVAGGITDESYPAFRIDPDSADMVEVGSADTHTRRCIYHILGQRQAGRVGRLLVSELYADPGCWSGYPPHKHDTEDGENETNHQELYHYRFDPERGFGGQSVYDEGEEPVSMTTRHGDTFLLDKGYHPTSTSPGHRGYIFTVLVGRQRRGLIQSFDPQHDYLMDAFPGIQAMRDKFR